MSTKSDRTENLLALLLLQQMKTATMAEKAQQLSVAGFSNTEIADLLRTRAAVIAQALYMQRRKPKKAGKTQ